jgi:signal transduction histidine kinase
MDLLSQSSLLVGVTSFGLGSSVLARNVKNKLFLAFGSLMAVISAWALTFFLEKIWGGGAFYRWHLFFNIWIGPFALFLIQVMTRIQSVLSRRFLGISVLLSTALSGFLILRYDELPWVKELIFFAPILIVFQLLQLIWLDRTHQQFQRSGMRRSIPRQAKEGPSPQRSRSVIPGFSRRNLIYFGGVIVLMTSVMDHIPVMGRTIPFFGNLSLTVYLFFISQAITQQRLLNFEALVSRFLVLLAVALTLTGVYSMLFAWIQSSTPLFFLNSFIVSFLLLTLLEPIRSMVGYFTQRLLTLKHRRLQEQLWESQRKLTGIIDLAPLFQAILQMVEQTVQPEAAALYVLRSDGTKYRRVRIIEMNGIPHEGGEPLPREIIVSHPLLQYCDRLYRKGDLPILLDQVIENELDRSASRVQRDYLSALIQGLKALHSNLLIPLCDNGRILGFVALRVDDPPEAWGSNWGLLAVIYPYFEQAARTLRSMEIYVRQREKERLAALGEMAAGLAHEIRNPLGAIKGAAQFLDPSADRPESKFLEVIIEEVDRLNRVVTQFLDYSKPPATNFEAVEVAELVEKTIQMMGPSIPPVIQIDWTRPRKPVLVSASSEQIRQVLINLIQNSVKALEKKSSGQIRVSIEAEGSEVAILVEDNGPGIRKENLEKLFIPFFTTSPSGTGLGLSISQKIIEAHRGRIEVATEEGVFSRFSVVLPMLAPELSAKKE